MSVFVIAEAATTWRYGDELETAKRSIAAAKACGADAWKTQWCSDGKALAKRRNMPANASIYEKRLQYQSELLESLKSACSDSGIEFMCTVYLAQDIDVIAPFVKRFKVSAFERFDYQMLDAVRRKGKDIKPLISVNSLTDPGKWSFSARSIQPLWCVSKYPTPLDEIHLGNICGLGGLSDHTDSVLTGAVAVGAGAQVIEKHVRLFDTPESDPDFRHSLVVDSTQEFAKYVQFIREAEVML